MSNTIFSERLQALKKSKKYSEDLLLQLEEITSKSGGKLPKEFQLKDAGRATISNLLNDLDITSFDIFAPNGSISSDREVVLR